MTVIRSLAQKATNAPPAGMTSSRNARSIPNLRHVEAENFQPRRTDPSEVTLQKEDHLCSRLALAPVVHLVALESAEVLRAVHV